MTDAQAWALAASVIAVGWLTLRFVHVERQEKRFASARELLHRERMAALDQGLVPPEEPRIGEPGSRAPLSWQAAVLGLGIVLLCAGVGFTIGLRLVPRTPEMVGMQELASLGLIPALAGAGLVLFWYLLGRSGGGAS